MGDAHIRPNEKAFQERLSRFLDSLSGKFDHLFIMGDLFEFWFGFRGFSYRNEYGPILESLGNLVRKGTQIVYFEGNHDFNMGAVFSQHLHAWVYSDATWFIVGGKRWFVTHGDLASARGIRYGTYRKLIRNRATYALIHLLGPRLMLGMADRLAALSHHVYHVPEAFNARRYREYVQDQCKRGYDVVIMGHTHRAEIRREGEGCLYVNCGDLKQEETYATYHEGEGFRLGRGLEPIDSSA